MNELGDLAVERGEEAAALAEPDLDRPLLRVAHRDELRHLSLRDGELLRMLLHRRLEELHLTDHLGVDVGDAGLGVELVEDVVEALRTEDQLERRGLGAGRVERDEPARDRPPALDQVQLRDAQLAPVLLDVAPDVRQLQVGEVDELVRAAEVRVQAVDLVQDLLRLGPLGVDRARRARERGDGDQARRERSEQHERRRTPSQAPQRPQWPDVVDAPVGPVQHEGRRLATSADGGNRVPPAPSLAKTVVS